MGDWHGLRAGVDASQRGKLKRVARALYTQEPTAAEASQWGMTLDEVRGPPVEVWPDNVPAVNAFITAHTQWRNGPMGRTGIEYQALPVIFKLTGIPEDDYPEVFRCVRTMEEVALKVMRS